MSKIFLAMIAMIAVTSCTMGLKYDTQGDVAGYVTSPKLNIEEVK